MRFSVVPAPVIQTISRQPAARRELCDLALEKVVPVDFDDASWLDKDPTAESCSDSSPSPRLIHLPRSKQKSADAMNHAAINIKMTAIEKLRRFTRSLKACKQTQ